MRTVRSEHRDVPFAEHPSPASRSACCQKEQLDSRSASFLSQIGRLRTRPRTCAPATKNNEKARGFQCTWSALMRSTTKTWFPGLERDNRRASPAALSRGSSATGHGTSAFALPSTSLAAGHRRCADGVVFTRPPDARHFRERAGRLRRPVGDTQLCAPDRGIETLFDQLRRLAVEHGDDIGRRICGDEIVSRRSDPRPASHTARRTTEQS